MLALVFLAIAPTLVSATPLLDNYVMHESRDAAPQGFVVSGVAPGEMNLELRINLAQNDIAGLECRYSGRYNASGRGYASVSPIGQAVEIVSNGSGDKVDGTSCSSPIFASVIGLINYRLLAAGKPVLGFLNPWVYANPQMFNDITSGTNPGCGTKGFSAKAG